MRNRRQLLIVNTKSREIELIRLDCTSDCTVARITRPIFDMLTKGDCIAYFAHRPDDIRVPMKINGRYYAKPSKYAESHATLTSAKV